MIPSVPAARARRPSALVLSAALLASAVSVGALPSAAQQTLSTEDVLRLESVGQVALSPDGRHVAYTVTIPRSAEETPGPSRTELRVRTVDEDDDRVIMDRETGASSPAWSPDGRWLGFRADLDDEATQVWAVPAGGGDARRLTSSPTSVSAFAWSPDADRLAYTAATPGPPDVDEARRRGDDVIVASERFRSVRLWVQAVDGGEARPLTTPDFTVRSFAWHPGGGWIAAQITEDPDTDAGYMYRDLFRVPLDGRPPTEIGPTPGKAGDMAFSPDGSRLAYLSATSFNDPLAQSLFVVPSEGAEEATNLTEEYEGSATDVAWLDDGTVLFVASVGTRTVLNAVDADGGEIRRLAGDGAEIFGSVDLDAGADRFAAAASTADHPAEVYLGDTSGGTLERLTRHNAWLDDRVLGVQRTVEWSGAEGWRIEGVLVEPVGYDASRTYPLAILPHGGPEGVSQDGWTTNPLYPAQLLAGEGYVVLMPNYRGSAGRGVAFSKADHRDLGGREFEDVLAGIDHLADLGMIDPDRVGISGTSYGGYFSAWGATRHSDRFAAAIPFAGLTNWISFTNTTDIPVEMSVVHFDLWWFDNPGIYMDRSPVTWADRSDTPTLVGHGLADDRVHPEQSIELHQALSLNGVETELVLYPREPHGLLERAHRLDFMERVLDWFGRHLKGEEPPVS